MGSGRARSLKMLDKFLFGFIALAMLYLFYTKWAVLDMLKPGTFHGPHLLDLLRIYGAYYSLFFFWAWVLLLQGGRFHGLFRLATLLFFVYFVVSDLANSATIQITGAIAPYDITYYAWLGAGNSPLPFNWMVILTILLVPALFIALPMLKYFALRRQEPTQSQMATKLGITASICLAISVVGPFTDRLDQNYGTPAPVYQLSRWFEDRLERLPEVTQAPVKRSLETQVTDSATPSSKPNVVMIVLESVGASALGTYNEQRAQVTPFLNKLAEDSIVVDRAYTTIPHTSKALVGILCGQEAFYRHPIYESHLGTPATCLPELLGKKGYHSLFMQSPTEHFENRRGLVEHMGFDDFLAGDEMTTDGFQLVNYFGYEDNIMLAPNQQWLETQSSEPFFAVYLTGATHHPYWSPTTYGYYAFDEDTGSHLNRYLNAMHYTDQFVKNLIEQYKDLGFYDNTLFVIVGDHGESLHQHERFQHNASPYEEVMQTPLLFHFPKQLRATRYKNRVVSHIDILPTVVEFLGYRVAPATKGLVLDLTGQQPTPQGAVYSACWYDNWCLTRIEQRYKYIHHFNERNDELFDLQSDPLETNNIASRHPEIVSRMKGATLSHYRENLGFYHSYFLALDDDYRDRREETVSEEIEMFGMPTRVQKLAEQAVAPKSTDLASSAEKQLKGKIN